MTRDEKQTRPIVTKMDAFKRDLDQMLDAARDAENEWGETIGLQNDFKVVQ